MLLFLQKKAHVRLAAFLVHALWLGVFLLIVLVAPVLPVKLASTGLALLIGVAVFSNRHLAAAPRFSPHHEESFFGRKRGSLLPHFVTLALLCGLGVALVLFQTERYISYAGMPSALGAWVLFMLAFSDVFVLKIQTGRPASAK